MGLFKLFSGESNDIQPGNPNPSNFTISLLEYDPGTDRTLVFVNYPGCTNFEGEKILLIKGKVGDFVSLDPHFLPDNKILARFRPDRGGIKLAYACLALKT